MSGGHLLIFGLLISSQFVEALFFWNLDRGFRDMVTGLNSIHIFLKLSSL